MMCLVLLNFYACVIGNMDLLRSRWTSAFDYPSDLLRFAVPFFEFVGFFCVVARLTWHVAASRWRHVGVGKWAALADFQKDVEELVRFSALTFLGKAHPMFLAAEFEKAKAKGKFGEATLPLFVVKKVLQIVVGFAGFTVKVFSAPREFNSW